MSSSGVAQQPRNDGGLGTVKRSFDISAVCKRPDTGASDEEITSAVFLGGKTYAASDSNRDHHHWIHILDHLGNYEGFVDALATGAIPAGLVLYDMTTDGQSLIVAVGESFDSGPDLGGIYVLDTLANPVDTILAENGPQSIGNPIRGPGFEYMRGFSTFSPPGSPYRGVAFDPSGNGGDGSFWVSDDGGVDALNEARAAPLVEIDLEGNILRELANNPDATGMPRGGHWLGAGLALDNQTGNLWVLADEDDNIVEVDVETGAPTGNVIPQELSPGGLRGGLSGLSGGDPGSAPGDFDLVVLSRRDGRDHIAYQRVNLYPRLPGVSEPFLEGSAGGRPLGTPPPILFTNRDTLSFAVNPNGQVAFPAFLFLNFGAEATTDVPSFLPTEIPELRAFSPLSMPPTAGSALVVPTAMGRRLDVNLAASGFPVATGDSIRIQSLYFHPQSQYPPGLMASNEIWFSGIGINQVLFEAVGPNSNNADTSSGFFRVHWLSGPDIVEVVLDTAQTPNPALQQMVFDTDAGGMADYFAAGNSDLTGCRGTYRNDSDAVAGLVYHAINNSKVALRSAICEFWISLGRAWTTGFVGGPGPGSSFQTLTFRFDQFGTEVRGGDPSSEPEVFEFDCDTDGGPVNGGGHAGLVVTFKLSDGTVFTGATLPDPADPLRSFIAF